MLNLYFLEYYNFGVLSKSHLKPMSQDILEEKGKSWIQEKREYEPGRTKPALIVDEKYEKVKTPEDMFITLLPHQKTIVKCMIDLENVRVVRGILNGKDIIIETCAGMLSDKPGSGKTYEILGLICHSKIPKLIPDISSSVERPGAYRKPKHYRGEILCENSIECEVRKKYARIVPCNLIFVSKSVLHQWEESIKNTGLKYLLISNIFDVINFYNMVFAPTKAKNLNYLKKFDIILVKNGKMSGKFDVPQLSRKIKDQNCKSILSVFGDLFKEYCFLRVFLDDFDMLNIPEDAYYIPALFTWFISATLKLNKRCRIIQPNNGSFNEDVAEFRQSYTSVWDNHMVLNYFNLQCEGNFIDTSIGAGLINYNIYKFANPNDPFINLFGVMGAEDTKNIVEALNGDAMRTAAQEAGLGNKEQHSVARIFEKVLDKKYKIWKHNYDVERYIDTVEPCLRRLPNIVFDYKLTEAILGILRSNLRKPGPESELKTQVRAHDERVDTVISEVKSQNAEEKEENGKAINRVRDNLKQGECPIMCTPLKDSQVIILACCGTAISREGAEIGLKLHDTKGNTIGICPNCRSDLKRTSLIFVDRDLNLDDIIQINIDKEKRIEESKKTNIVEEQEENSVFDKYECIMNIIKGTNATKKLQEQVVQVRSQREGFQLKELLQGKISKGLAPEAERKFLVYSTFKETLDLITGKLKKNKIQYEILNGTPKQIQDIVAKFWLNNEDKNSFKVLLLNGHTYCAGLNLQCITDVIFAHHTDHNVEIQVAGRAARYGRKYDLNIHYVLYENEISITGGKQKK